MSEEVSGFKDLSADIGRLNKDLQKMLVSNALRRGAETLADKIREMAPVATGKLKGSVKTRKARSEWYEPTIEILIREFYGRFQEFGWVPRNRHSESDIVGNKRAKRAAARKKRGGKRVGERPYIRPAFHQYAESAGNEILISLGDAIEKSFRGS